MSLFSAEKVSELDRFWREMAPVPGRMAFSLRFALSTALATLAMLILQARTFYIATGLYFLFFGSYDTPLDCFKSLLKGMVGAALGTASATVLVIASGNHPVARVMGLALCTFLGTFFFRTSSVPVAAVMYAVFAFNATALWEKQIRDETILRTSMWAVATLGVASLCAVAVQYVFNRSDPLLAWRRQIQARCTALEKLLLLCATHAEAKQIEEQSAIVRRYAVTGRGQMHVLLERISKSHSCSSAELSKLTTVTLMLDRLLFLGAGFAIHHELQHVDSARLERISRAIVAIGEGHPESVKDILGDVPTAMADDLDNIEQTLHHGTQSTEQSAEESQAPSRRWWELSVKNFFVPDVLANEDYYIYALKVSLCGTICYVIYNAIGWPGISTCYYTVLFTGLSTTGASSRKLLHRAIGSTIGGLILGIACMIWVFPNIEWVSNFMLVIFGVAFIAAWIAVSSYFGYIGLQTAFSFYLLAFERLRAPAEMQPARDRLDGIAIGLLVMLFFFYGVRPERTVDTMRRLLARMLRGQAELIRLWDMETNAERDAKIDAIRKQIEAGGVNLQSFADVVKFEYDPDRAADMRLSNEILNAATSATDVLLGVPTWPGKFDSKEQTVQVKEVRNALENGLLEMASWLEQVPREQPRVSEETVLEKLRSRLPVSIAKTIDSYRELKMVCDGIVREAA